MLWLEEYPIQKTDKIAEKIQSEMPGLEILEIKEWFLPVYDSSVDVYVSQFRKLNIIEEFILRLLEKNIKEFGNEETIQEILQLDAMFISPYLNDMLAKQLIDREQGYLKLTEKGGKAHKEGLLPINTLPETVNCFYDPYFKSYYDYAIPLSTYPTITEQFRYSKEYDHHEVPIAPTPKEISDIASEQGKVLETQELGRKILSISSPVIAPDYNKAAFYGEIWCFDPVDQQVFCRVWNFQTQSYSNEIQQILTEEDRDKYLKMVITKEEVERKTYKENVKKVLVQNRNQTDKNNMKKEVEILRGHKIREEFLNAIDSTNKKLIIISPWISDKVVDNEMINKLKRIAKKNGVIYIGWGIAKERDKEDRLPPQHLIDTLKGIKNSKGQPAIYIHWIGNHHNKEVVVDDYVHFLGSFNWLSYRGDYSLRNESVTKVSNKEIVQEELTNLENLFINRIKSRLSIMSLEEKVLSIYELMFLSTYKETEVGLMDSLLKETFLEMNDENLYQLCSFIVEENGEIPTLPIVLSYLNSNLKDEKKLKKLMKRVKKLHPDLHGNISNWINEKR
ncbi:phospholipase D-like domain-containing protein [Litchfieldia alkalitelluris]|uniref:phospholipase D-like domain-containing protein n=1 Tax=Litchfieldia alkalitelluris TaxID=304268 RepID=UPI0009968074|nr:phospholipase D-like domain-containing protein [Litchfieldia alkalitelluris]